MIRGNVLNKMTGAILTGAITVLVSSVGAYIAVSKAQENHETRIDAIEQTQREQPASIDKAEQRINQRLDSIQTDVREIRKLQSEMLQRDR